MMIILQSRSFQPPHIPVLERHSISITIPYRPPSLSTDIKVIRRWRLTIAIKARLYCAATDYYELWHLSFRRFHFTIVSTFIFVQLFFFV